MDNFSHNNFVKCAYVGSMKTCSKCKIKYPATTEYFSSDKRHKNGLDSWCKKCKKANSKIYYQKNLEKSKIAQKKYYQQHSKEIKAYQKIYRATLNGHLRLIYNHIKQRCNNPKDISYEYYGGRGIKCLFKSFKEFADYVINDLQIDPRGLQIDRIDNNGHYKKKNIRFVTAKENCKNRRKRRMK